MISIRFQKIWKFIPLLNGLVWWFFYINCWKMKWGNIAALKALLIAVATVFVPGILWVVIESEFSIANGDFWLRAINYLSALAMGFGLIRLQENLLKKE